jgi:hypothetical protein
VSAETGDGQSVTDALRNRVALGVAVLALIALAAMIVALWGKADDPNNETAWARWTYLLAGVEAVAFAGAGFLFGREVNRAAVEAAQEQAAEANQTAQEANQNAQEQAERAGGTAAAGRTVRNAIEAKERALAGAGGERTDLLGGQEVDARVAAHLRELGDLARTTFPD